MGKLIVSSRMGAYPIFFQSDITETIETIIECVGHQSVVIISNDTVFPLYGKQLQSGLTEAKIKHHTIILPDGEQYKTITTYLDTIQKIDALRITRKSFVIALGGGVVGDIAGFVASTILRGIRLIQIPTTLLAMVDSSVGGKTGVNTLQGKNRLGTFYAPKMICMPIKCLETLAVEEIKSGLGEIIKHGLIGSLETIEILEQQGQQILQCEEHTMRQLITLSCQLKANIVAQDELETGRRAVLNFGHTIGHGLEKTLEYGTLRHGECIAIGLLIEMQLAVEMGCLAPSVVKRIRSLMKILDMSSVLVDLNKEELFHAISFDKKIKNGKITLCILKEVGAANLEEVSLDELFRLCDHIMER